MIALLTLLLEIAGAVVLYVLVLSFFPFILTGAFGLLCLFMTFNPELGNAGRAVAVLGVFGSIWWCWKMIEVHRQERGYEHTD